MHSVNVLTPPPPPQRATLLDIFSLESFPELLLVPIRMGIRYFRQQIAIFLLESAGFDDSVWNFTCFFDEISLITNNNQSRNIDNIFSTDKLLF